MLGRVVMLLVGEYIGAPLQHVSPMFGVATNYIGQVCRSPESTR